MAGLTRNAKKLKPARKSSLACAAVGFSASILVGLLAGLALQVWTLAYLGHLGGEALYLRAVYTPVSFLVLAVTEGLAVASQVSAGIATRNGRHDVLRPIPTYASVSGGVLLLTAVTFAAGQGLVFSALGVDAANRHRVVMFMVAMCLASAVGLLPGMAGAVLRGMGRTGAASLLAVGSTALSIAAITVLGVATDLGVLAVPAGAAIASVAASAAAAKLLRGALHHPPGSWLQGDALRDLRTFGAPVAATFLLLSVVSAGYLRVLRHAGTAGVSGFSLGQNANTFFMVVAVAIGSGVAVAVNLREGEDRRPVIEAGLAATLRLALPAYAVIGTLAYLLRQPLAGLLTSDRAVAAVGASYFMWMGPTFTVLGATLALLTYLEQAGRASAAFALNTIYFAVLFAIAFALPQPVSSATLTRVLAASNIIGFATCWFSARYLIRRSR